MFSNPEKHSYLFKGIPRSILQICKLVQGIMMHCDTTHLYNTTLSDEQKQDRESRYVKQILSRLIKQDKHSLNIKREPSKRFAGNCRDFALFLCAILRYQGVPSRVRCGFASYFTQDFYEDHWVCEYWNNKNKWIAVDVEIDEVIKRAYKITVNPLNVSSKQFLSAGKAWQMCRMEKLNSNKFGVSKINIKGLWFIRGSVLRDFLALNKVELMPWDYTAFSDKQFKYISELATEEIKLIDNIADLTNNTNQNFLKIRELYKKDSRLRVEGMVNSYTLKGLQKVLLEQ